MRLPDAVCESQNDVAVETPLGSFFLAFSSFVDTVCSLLGFGVFAEAGAFGDAVVVRRDPAAASEADVTSWEPSLEAAARVMPPATVMPAAATMIAVVARLRMRFLSLGGHAATGHGRTPQKAPPMANRGVLEGVPGRPSPWRLSVFRQREMRARYGPDSSGGSRRSRCDHERRGASPVTWRGPAPAQVGRAATACGCGLYEALGAACAELSTGRELTIRF